MEKHLKEINYLIVAKPVNEAVMGFKAYRVVGETETGELEFTDKKEPYGYPTDNIKRAVVFAEGTISFDGCMNIRFVGERNTNFHFCGRKQAGDVGKMLGELYAMAGEMMPQHKEYFQEER